MYLNFGGPRQLMEVPGFKQFENPLNNRLVCATPNYTCDNVRMLSVLIVSYKLKYISCCASPNEMDKVKKQPQNSNSLRIKYKWLISSIETLRKNICIHIFFVIALFIFSQDETISAIKNNWTWLPVNHMYNADIDDKNTLVLFFYCNRCFKYIDTSHNCIS